MREREKTLIYFFLLLFLGVFIFFFLLPKYREVKNLRKEICRIEKEINTMKEQFKKTKSIYEEIEKKEEAKKAKRTLPESPNEAEILNLIQTIATQSGLSIKEISLQKSKRTFQEGKESQVSETRKKELGEIKISFELLGEYESFKKFLQALEKSSRLIQVNKINFASPKEEKFNFKVEAEAFYLLKK